MMPIHDWYENVAKPLQAEQVQEVDSTSMEQIPDKGKGMDFGKGADFDKGEGKGKGKDSKGEDNKGKVEETQRGGWLKRMVQLAIKVKAEDWAACTMMVEGYEGSSDSFALALNNEINKQNRHSA